MTDNATGNSTVFAQHHLSQHRVNGGANRLSTVASQLSELHRWSVWRSLFLGQALSLLNTCTGIASQLLVSEFHISLPTAQSFLNYVLLCAVFTCWLLVRAGCLGYWRVLRQRGWQYLCLSIIDVEANYLVVKAYKYTTITSITLLDCFSIPVVLALSWVLLKVRYKLLHIVGVSVCLLGVGCLVWADIGDTALTVDGRERLLGDMLCLSGATLYGISNVGQELAVKRHNSLEFLAMIGLFGTVVNGVQLAVLERRQLTAAEVPWTDWRVLALLATFSVCQFGFYALTPHVLAVTSAATVNLSLLTSDFFALIAGILIFGYKFNALYFVSFFMVVCGIVVYSCKPTPLHHIGQPYSDTLTGSGDLMQGHTAATSVTDFTQCSASQCSAAPSASSSCSYGAVERSHGLPRSQSIPARVFHQTPPAPAAAGAGASGAGTAGAVSGGGTLGRPWSSHSSTTPRHHHLHHLHHQQQQQQQRPYRTLERSHSGARVHWAGSPSVRSRSCSSSASSEHLANTIRLSTFRAPATAISPPLPPAATATMSGARSQPEGILKKSSHRPPTALLYDRSPQEVGFATLEDVQC